MSMGRSRAGGITVQTRALVDTDHVLKIGDQPVGALPYYRVAELLSGKPGEARKLALIREGNP